MAHSWRFLRAVGFAEPMTEKQAKVLAERRQRLCEFTTSQIAGSRIGSKEMQVAVQVSTKQHAQRLVVAASTASSDYSKLVKHGSNIRQSFL